MEAAGCPLRPLTRPVSATGCWLHGCSSFTAGGACGPATRVPVLGAEPVSAPPPPPRSPVFAQGTAVTPYFTCCSHNGEGGLGQAGVDFKPYTSYFHTILRLLCSAGFKCHRSHYTQISAQRGPITCINKYSNKQCGMRTLFPPDPWFCLVGRSCPRPHVGCVTVHSQPQGQCPTHSRYSYLSTTSVGRHSHTPPPPLWEPDPLSSEMRKLTLSNQVTWSSEQRYGTCPLTFCHP